MPPELRSQADQGLTPWGFLTLWQEDDFAWKDAINSAEDLATGVAATLSPPDLPAFCGGSPTPGPGAILRKAAASISA